MAISNKFNYVDLPREEIDGIRYYVTPTGKLPSVTTILSATKSKEDRDILDNWKNAVGETRATEIVNEASGRGSRMHAYLEKYVLDGSLPKTGSNPYARQAHAMATTIIEKGLSNVDAFYGTEVPLYYDGIYAGTTDLVGSYTNIISIIDFKQSNKPKTSDMIHDYCVQLAAYADAHNKMFNTTISQGVIMMSVKPDMTHNGIAEPTYLEWVVSGEEFELYRELWWCKVEEYYENV